MNEEALKKLLALMVNHLMALGVATGMNEKFNKDLIEAAGAYNINILDLLNALHTSEGSHAYDGPATT